MPEKSIEVSSPEMWATRYLDARVDELIAIVEAQLLISEPTSAYGDHVTVTTLPETYTDVVYETLRQRYLAAGWYGATLTQDKGLLLYFPDGRCEQLVHTSILDRDVNLC